MLGSLCSPALSAEAVVEKLLCTAISAFDEVSSFRVSPELCYSNPRFQFVRDESVEGTGLGGFGLFDLKKSNTGARHFNSVHTSMPMLRILNDRKLVPDGPLIKDRGLTLEEIQLHSPRCSLNARVLKVKQAP